MESWNTLRRMETGLRCFIKFVKEKIMDLYKTGMMGRSMHFQTGAWAQKKRDRVASPQKQ